MAKRYTMISLDPGLYSTGVAYWDLPDRNRLSAPFLTALWETRSRKKDVEWTDRAEMQCGALKRAIEVNDVKWVFSEFPQFWNSEQGHAAAGNESLTKLAFLVGAFAGVCYSAGVKFETVSVNVWKGQLPKQVVIERVKAKLGSQVCVKFRDDIWDAVGIGLWVKGNF